VRFFNHLLVQPNFSVVVLANTKRKQVRFFNHLLVQPNFSVVCAGKHKA